MTLEELISRACVRFALSTVDRARLTEAVIAVVEDGQLAVVPDMPALARRLGEVTLYRCAYRILEERLAQERTDEQLFAEPVAQAPYPKPAPLRPTKQRACSLCHVLGHKITTCPRLR